MMRLLFILLLATIPRPGFAGIADSLADSAKLLIVHARAENHSAGISQEEIEIVQEAEIASPAFRKPENKKLVAALFAIPPLGIVGLHRIYLRTEPYVPVVYLLTLGGACILPLIDLAVILISDEEQLKKYENNKKIFMWMK